MRLRYLISAMVLWQGSASLAQLQVEAVRINGSAVAGIWMPGQEGGKISIRTEIRQEILSPDDLLSLRVVHQQAPASMAPWPVTISCRNGSILPAETLEGDETKVVLRTPFSERVALPLEQIRMVRWRHAGDACRQSDGPAGEPAPGRDALIVLQQDSTRMLEGALERLSARGGSFRFRDRSLEFESDGACAVVMAATGQARTAAVTCVVNDGYHLAGEIQATTADGIVLQTVAGAAVTLDLTDIQELRFNSRRVVYLSDLQPAAVEQRGFFDVPWPTRFDRAASNQPMRMKGRSYSKGIGVHSESNITYSLDGSFASLSATIGIDDRVRPAGHVVYRVLADGQEVFSSTVEGTDDPRDIDVRLDGARTLRLVVEQGDELDIGDHANWAEARLIRR